ncbi:MAG: nucleotide exchange factor GrpE [Desulfobacteraceae bacterium]|nr:nucleotide exchange factor GrpE [Desulfobacteraceae bacterium]
MDDKNKTKKQLIKELEELRQRVSDLEDTESERKLLAELEELDTEHNWPEKALHESEKRYQALIETNLYGIQEIDIYGIITYMNSVLYKILGYQMGELKGKQIWDLLATDSDREELTDYLTRIAEGEYASFPWVGNYVRKEGGFIKLQVGWNYRKDTQGRIVGFVSVISSILDDSKKGKDGSFRNKQADEDYLLSELTGTETEAAANKVHKPPEKEKTEEKPVLKEAMELKMDTILKQLDVLQKNILIKAERARNEVSEHNEQSEVQQKKSLQVSYQEETSGPIFLQLTGIMQQLDLLHGEFQNKLKLDAHKNKIIDNLHQDLQDYKDDFLKKYLKSVIMDVIQIIDNIRKLAAHYSNKELSDNDLPKMLRLLESIPTDLEDLFYRHGVKPFSCEGNIFDPTRQRVLKTLKTPDTSRDKTVAESLRPGYEWDGKVIRPEMVAAYIYEDKKADKGGER